MENKELEKLLEILSDGYSIKWLTIKIEPKKKKTKRKKSKSDNRVIE